MRTKFLSFVGALFLWFVLSAEAGNYTLSGFGEPYDGLYVERGMDTAVGSDGAHPYYQRGTYSLRYSASWGAWVIDASDGDGDNVYSFSGCLIAPDCSGGVWTWGPAHGDMQSEIAGAAAVYTAPGGSGDGATEATLQATNDLLGKVEYALLVCLGSFIGWALLELWGRAVMAR